MQGDPSLPHFLYSFSQHGWCNSRPSGWLGLTYRGEENMRSSHGGEKQGAGNRMGVTIRCRYPYQDTLPPFLPVWGLCPALHIPKEVPDKGHCQQLCVIIWLWGVFIHVHMRNLPELAFCCLRSLEKILLPLFPLQCPQPSFWASLTPASTFSVDPTRSPSLCWSAFHRPISPHCTCPGSPHCLVLTSGSCPTTLSHLITGFCLAPPFSPAFPAPTAGLTTLLQNALATVSS